MLNVVELLSESFQIHTKHVRVHGEKRWRDGKREKEKNEEHREDLY